jgi:hypothetical protein
LNPTERYGTLLESWLLRGSSDIVGERTRYGDTIPDNFYKSAWFLADIPDDGLQVAGNPYVEDGLPYRPGWHNWGLLPLFGCVRVEQGVPEPGDRWCIERVYRTQFGDALFSLLARAFFGDFDRISELALQEDARFGVLQPILKPYFSEWRNNLAILERATREGVHVFRVSLGRIWRRIAIPALAPLDSLASAIINSVGFSHDHLYNFSYENRFGGLAYLNHPYMDEGPWASEVEIGDLPIRIGEAMDFLYDFGDQWEFDVVLERVDPEMDVQEPVVLERHGESPEQYPRWE